MSATAIITEKCHYCTRGRSPRDFLELPGGIKLCHECHERHQQGLLAMSGLKANSDGTFTTAAPPPPECSECRISAVQLRLRAGRGDIEMAVHYEGGVYRILCLKCSELYVAKRKDIYGDTQYGYEKGLK